MSHFGNLVRRLRKEKGVSQEVVAKRLGTHKGYISGIENDQVNPPSVKFIRKYAAFFGQDVHRMALLAWVDKAPALLRKDAEEFLSWSEKRQPPPQP